MSSSVPDSDWSTSTIFSNLLDFAKCFSVCSFVWTSRTSNFVAHIAAKLALFYCMPFPFNKDNLPLALVVACKEDYHACSQFSQYWIEVYQKKKKRKKEEESQWISLAFRAQNLVVSTI